MKRTIFLRLAAGTLLLAASFFAGGCRPPASGIESEINIPSLKDVCAPYFEIGAAVEPYQLSSMPHDALLQKHFNSIVAENVMKPVSLQPSEGYFNWTEADKIVNYAKAHGMKLRFHTLVWHNQVPDWFFEGNDKNLLLQRLEKHIRTIIQKYGDKVDYWDVVNEVIDPSQPDGMRRSKWYLIAGKDYIKTAFRVADNELTKHGWRKKGSQLYINDYNTHLETKRNGLWNLIQELRQEGIPVDGVGHQTHINIVWPSVKEIVDSIRFFGEKGLDNQVTELDVSIYTNTFSSYGSYEAIPRELLLRQGYRYKELFEGLKSVGNYISNVTFWGMADDHTWLDHWPIERPDAPLPFDIELKAKPAYWGIIEAGISAGAVK